MSRKADLTFCKVAITAGLVSQEQAQKALAFVDKREQETGRRPLIGAVFTKYRLLTQEEVQRVNVAVAKRLGGTHPVAARTAAASKKGGGKRRKPKRKPIDPKLLKQGIGFGVLFLAVVIVIAVLYVNQPSDEDTGAGSGGTAVAGIADPGAGSGGSGAGARVAAAPTEELSREIAGRFMLLFNDIRRDVDENPPRARKLLAKAEADLAELEKRFIIPTDLDDLHKAVAAAVKSAKEIEDPRDSEVTSGGAEPEAGGTDAGAAGGDGDDDDDDAAAEGDIEIDDGDLDDLDDLDLDDLDLDDF